MSCLPIFDPFQAWNWLLSQAPAPSPTPSASPSSLEVELLKSQLEFLKDSNTRLGDSFTRFVGAMQFTLVVFGALGGLLAYVVGKNLDDAKKVASQMIRQEMEGQVATLLKTEIESVKRTLRRERVIGSTLVDYYLQDASTEPTEFKLLQARGFQNVRFHIEEGSLRRLPGDVVILDLENWVNGSGEEFPQLSEDVREQQAKQQIDALLGILPTSTVLVVYVRSTVKYLFKVPKNRYMLPANNPVTLIGNTADAAYVAAGDRSTENS